MSQKLIELLVHFSDFFLRCNCLFFFYRNMYYLPNFDFAEIIGINEISSKDQK